MKQQITLERLRELLSYDPETGHLTWLVTKSNRAPKGSIAGSPDKHGYLQLGLDQRDYKAHRIAWALMMGEWPKGPLDHINGVQWDNRWVNLRQVSQAINTQNARRPRSNNKTGFLGVSPHGKTGFRAQLMLDGKVHCLGSYRTPEEAHAAYVKAKRQLHQGNTL